LLVALWAAYLAATIAAPVVGFVRRQEPGSLPDRDS
jgi:hypothetical protein